MTPTGAILANSLAVAAGTAVSAGGLGLAAALATRTLPRVVQNAMHVLALLVLAMPPFLLLSYWIGQTGGTVPGVRGGTSYLFSLPGGVFLLSLWLWPITTLAVRAAWTRLGPGLLEQDPAIKGWIQFRTMLWPCARGAWWTAAGLTAILALNQFTIPTVLQIKVLPEAAWIAFNTRFDTGTALLHSLPLVLLGLTLAPFLKWRTFAQPLEAQRHHTARSTSGAERSESNWNPLRAWLRGCLHSPEKVGAAVFCAALGFVSIGLPLGGLMFDARTWIELPATGQASAEAAKQSFVLAAATATCATGLGWILSRWKVCSAWIVFFLMPGFLFGITSIAAFNRPGFDGWYPSNLLIGLLMVIRYAGWPILMLVEARRTEDRDLLDAAKLDGLRGWLHFHKIQWPQWRSRAGAAWTLVFLLALWDVETGVLIVPPGGETLALRVFHLLHYGHNTQVYSICAMLLMMALAPLVFGALGKYLGWLGSAFFTRTALLLLLSGVTAGTGCGSANPDEVQWRSRFFESVQIMGKRGTGPGEFNKPRSLAVDSMGCVYAADMTGRIVKFAQDGAFERFWELEVTDKGKPKGMAAAAQGGVWVVEPHYTRVTRFDALGSKVEVWGVEGTNAGQLAFPRSIALTPKGELAVSEYSRVERVQVFSNDGRSLVRSWGQGGAATGEFNRAEGLAVAPDGRFFVADSCNHRIQVFDSNGQPLASFGGAGTAPGKLSYPYDVKVNAEGMIFVCEFGNSRVQIFDSQYRSVEILGGAGSRPGQFNNPWSIALDAEGNLYVADALNHRLQKFSRRSSTPLAPVARPSTADSSLTNLTKTF
ncbi:MAG: hypothetical protein FJ404_09420 [Verrucomicrobia bacterium]|nr:hypothetical protein [Verrucomicrobiota bacterium]